MWIYAQNKWLEEAEKILDSLLNLGIAGVAGKSRNKGGGYNKY